MIELERHFRADRARILSALIGSVGDFDLAEDVLQEAFAAAAERWGDSPPVNPAGWLYATALHRALDRRRAARRHAQRLSELPPAGPHLPDVEVQAVPDERLRLVFTCCHPALPLEAQVALTLRTLGGLATEAIARAFLVPVPTMAQRLVRAKAKIREAGIPYEVPGAAELPERVAAVLQVIYLVFTEGHTPSRGHAAVDADLCAEAIALARTLASLLPQQDEIEGLLALLLLQDARRAARHDAAGDLVLLADQDRSLWDRARIEEGTRLVEASLRRGPPGPYALEAAIAAVHAEAARAEDTDWAQIRGLYERLVERHPSPVVKLNLAVAVAMERGPAEALPLVDALERDLSGYHLWHAARADLLRRLGRSREARSAYRRARELTGNEAERRFLERRIAELEGPG